MTVSTCRDDDDVDDEVDDDDDDDDDHDDDDDDDNCHKYFYEVVLCCSFEKGSTSEAKWQHQMRVAMGAKRNFVLLGETDDPQLKWHSKQNVVGTAPMDGLINMVPLLTNLLFESCAIYFDPGVSIWVWVGCCFFLLLLWLWLLLLNFRT